MGKKKAAASKEKADKRPAWSIAVTKVNNGILHRLAYYSGIYCEKTYPMAKTDWAYVTNNGCVYLNPYRDATVGEWEYVISHCLLHLGFGHFREDRREDRAWEVACDMVVAKFLRDSHIGAQPPEFCFEFPFPVKDEEQVYQRLQETGVLSSSFSTMTNGRPDMVWSGKTDRLDYEELLAESLQTAMEDALRSAKGLPPERSRVWGKTKYLEARDWFLSSFPLLGAAAASFRIVDEPETVHRMNIPVAAVSPQMGELYINPRCHLELGEWKFVLAH